MPIKLKCPKCGEAYTVADNRAGQSFRCRECREPVKVPVDMFTATLDKMERDIATEMETEGETLSMDELMAMSEDGDALENEQSGPATGTSTVSGPPWMAITIGVIAVAGIAAGLAFWLM